MGIHNFDIKTFLTNLKATKPPYLCPHQGCGKIYKTYSGIDYHLHHHNDYDSGAAGTTPFPKNKLKKGRKGACSAAGTPKRKRSPSPSVHSRSPKQLETLTYAESQRMVEVEVEGQIYRLSIFQPLAIIPQDEIDNCDNAEKENREGEKTKVNETVSKTPNKGKPGKETKKGKESKGQKDIPVVSANNNNNSGPVKLPEATFTVLDEWVKPTHVPKRPTAYYRFMEKTAEELAEEVEYDLDEEDYAWLEIINKQRSNENLTPVSQGTFEFLMDRFEKEAHFQSQSSGKDISPPIDDDAVCSICMDGECQNSNVILFCDMCNLAVHQECYGVPYIPEGQWMCRRCLQSPSRAVECCLCPNKEGAFKQTDDARWSHVVCALWIPEVGFANTVFLEPIDCLDRIPIARWKLTCYICKQRSVGACIQCHKTNCYTAFHVTCAQQAGLYMKIEPVKENTGNGQTVTVRKTAFCDVHNPPNIGNFLPMIDNGVADDDENRPKKPSSPANVKADNKIKMRKARKILAEKRISIPIVSIPSISSEKLSKISAEVKIQKKEQFIRCLQSYWTLKRQSRNGVPLLRRLQSSAMTKNKTDQKTDAQNNALKQKLKYWQRLRQDLEKARLLVELIRKREKLKREQLKIHHMATEMQLTPFLFLLRNTLDQLESKDKESIFAEPVDLEEVHDYLTIVTTPMDFSTMRKKMESHQYNNFDTFEKDFNLIVNNCISYNAKDTTFYKQAIKLRDQGGVLIRNAKRMAANVGYVEETGLLTEERPATPEANNLVDDVEEVLSGKKRKQLPVEEQLKILLDHLDAVTNTQRPGRKTRLEKRLKSEIFKVRRQLARQNGQNFMSDVEDGNTSVNTATDDEDEEVEIEATPSSSRKGGYKASSAVAMVVETPAAAVASTSTPASESRGRKRGGYKKTTPAQRKQVTEPIGTPGIEGESSSAHNKAEEKKEASPSASPAGVNRRNTVLFSKKARKHEQSTAAKSTPASRRGSKGAANSKKEKEKETAVKEEAETTSTTSTGGRKRKASVDSEAPLQLPPSKRLATELADDTPSAAEPSSPGANPTPSFVIPPRESFTTYRSLGQQYESEIDSTSECGSTATSATSADSTSEDFSDGGTPKASGSGGGTPAKKKDSLPAPSNPSDSSTTPSEVPQTPKSSNKQPKSNGGEGDNTPVSKKRRPNPTTTPASSSKKRGGGGRLNIPPKNQRPIDAFFQKAAEEGSSNKGDAAAADDDGAGETTVKEEAVHNNKEGRHNRSSSWCSETIDSVQLEPLDLVWAKCQGYPWYPALIINPKMPKTGYLHNGVPIPVPPEDVLLLSPDFEKNQSYLVLFFDAKRTWQWLPRNKLEPLGVDSGLDKNKLMENKKQNVKKAVKKAYEKAILHRCRVTGEPNPLSADFCNDVD